MKDPDQREMFLIRAGKDTVVYHFDSTTHETLVASDGEQARMEKKSAIGASEPVWTHGEAHFSNSGSYLTTTHAQGVRVWAGTDFAPVKRLKHRNAVKVMFSRDEKYVATWNGNKTGEDDLCIHSLLTGEIIQSMPVRYCGI